VVTNNQWELGGVNYEEYWAEEWPLNRNAKHIEGNHPEWEYEPTRRISDCDILPKTQVLC